jgi:dienelactone hydrolase
MRIRTRTRPVVLTLVALLSSTATASAQTTESLTIRGKPQALRLYGQRGNPPVIVSSGDGGWIHLGPHVAETLAAHNFFVVGVDVKAYLESFTLGSTTLRPEDEPRDYAALAAYAAKGSSQKPILIGVSEGAGLSVLAATDPSTKAAIAGVIGLGLPDLNELGWRWRDSLIYVTHGVPKEPTFSTQAIVDRVAPTPLAAIHSTQDEFVPLAEAQRIIESARDPKRLWVIKASDHRFSDNLAEFDQRLLEAIAWVRSSAKE